ncbi:hypothetical protein M514_20872, partial [Trichuris suis]
ADEKIPGNL